jgi:2-polyprenyl-3-methyl-5-hydroxy-6-metoxy-1,4-benzoquinol methylase
MVCFRRYNVKVKTAKSIKIAGGSVGKRYEIKSDITNCPSCNADDLFLLTQRAAYSLYKCARCSLIFKHIGSLKQEIVQELQDGVYTESYLTNRLRQHRLINRMNVDRLDMLNKWKEGGNLLEIGCGTGEFLAGARDRGFHTLGIDASRKLAACAEKKHINVKCGRIENLKLPLRHFDVICVFHVLEHIETPKRFLLTLRGLLKKHGIIFIITPHVRSFTNKMFGWKHPNYTQEDHLLFFSKATLKNLLVRHNFEVVDVFTKEYTHHIFTSLLGFLKGCLKPRRADKRSSAAKGMNRTCQYSTTARETGQYNKIKMTKKLESSVKALIWQMPYFLSLLLYPMTFLYKYLIEKSGTGHELILVARKIER